MQLFENLSEEENTDAEVRKMTNNLFLFNTFRLISLGRWQEGSQWQMVLEIVAWAQFRNITPKISVGSCLLSNQLWFLKKIQILLIFLGKTLSPASFFTSNHQRTRAGGVQEPVLGQVWPFSSLYPAFLFVHTFFSGYGVWVCIHSTFLFFSITTTQKWSFFSNIECGSGNKGI